MQNPEDEKFIEYNAARLQNLKYKLQIKHQLVSNWVEYVDLSRNLVEVLALAGNVLSVSVEKSIAFSRVPQSKRLTILLNNCLDLIRIPRKKLI